MKKTIYSTIFLAFILLLNGCSGPVRHMNIASENKVLTTPTKGKAQIVFIRSKSHTPLISYTQSSLFEIKDSKPTILAVLTGKQKIIHEVNPGEHLFMVVGESADFMKVNLLANKTYFAFIKARMGAWAQRFSLRAVHKGNALLKNLYKLEDYKLLEASSDTLNWANENIDDINKKYHGYYKKWMKKRESSRPYLRAEDGVDIPK